MLVTCSSTKAIQLVIDQLHREFALKDLGVHHFLGVIVTQFKAGLHLTQSTYISEVLQRVNMADAKPISNTSQLASSSTGANTEPFSDVTLYRSIVGAFQYMTISRPDISYADSINQRLLFTPSTSFDLFVKTYTDSDWAGCQETRISTSGFWFFDKLGFQKAKEFAWIQKLFKELHLSLTTSQLIL
ncbi:hypothetical protein LIER_39776 [Lithospermum erythrorhizon]|uniref:Reverse transcriptase Ty1/copia-type domain-containing protein n=1 Tax=Lithospermum erythrorhizon TaxID=34254 RepID=A0AAV3QMG5_LITER